jgi:hypothetical protein
MLRTGIITTYLILRLLVISGFIDIYPTFCRDQPRLLELPTHPEVGPLNTSAFVGTNPTGELITSGLPVIRPELTCMARLRVGITLLSQIPVRTDTPCLAFTQNGTVLPYKDQVAP